MESKNISVLEIGNSFGFDAIAQSEPIFRALGYEKVKLNAFHYPSCDLFRYLKYIDEDKEAFWTYEKPENEEWIESYPKKFLPSLTELHPDVVTLMPGNYDLYNPERLSDDLDTMHDYIVEHLGYEPVFYFIAIPPIVCESGEEYPEQETAIYSAMKRFVKEYIPQKAYIKDIIPTGATVANLRAIGYKEELTRDTLHMSIPLGRYACALTFTAVICDTLPSFIDYTEDGISEKDMENIEKCADFAITNPLDTIEI